MTTIGVNTTIDQTWVNSNTPPYTVSASVIVTIGSDITFNTNTNYYFIMNDNSTINGDGYKFTILNISGYTGVAIVSATKTGLLIKNLGVVYSSSSLASGGYGGIFSPNGFATDINIYRCYCVIDINNSLHCGGIYGEQDGNGDTVYIVDCYHIGDINNPSSNSVGGIVGRLFGGGTNSVGVLMNCYHIGTVATNGGGAILGAFAGGTNGNAYAINCYYTDGPLYVNSGIGSNTPVYFGYNREYNGSSWSDASALSSLYSQESSGTLLTPTEILTDGPSPSPNNYTKVWGSGTDPTTNNLDDFYNNFLTIVQTSPYYSYFKFPSLTNQPWGLRNLYNITPFVAAYYTQATDEAHNCFCKGTKITTINEDNVKVYIQIEKMRKGMVVVTPHGVNKRVLQVGRFWYSGSKPKHMAHLIPKDYFTKGIPFEDTYCSGAHSLMYSKRNAEYIGLSMKEDRVKERSNGMNLYLIKNFGEIQDFHKVSAIKGESGKPYGFYYYHLVVEDDAGYYANGLSSESLEMKDFIANFEEINV